MDKYKNSLGRILTILLFGIVTNATAAPGDLDTTFGGTGKVRQAFGSGDERINAVSIQPDGKIVAAGYAQNGANQQFMLIRYNADGSLDASFGDGGKVFTAIGISSSEARTVIVQADGKIVAGGKAYQNNTDLEDFAIVRYNADGSLDLTFGNSGKVLTDFFDQYDSINAVGLLADGRLLAVGVTASQISSSDKRFALARYNADGSPDQTFGSGGQTSTNTANLREANNLAFVGSDKFVVAGRAEVGGFSYLALARFNPNGTLDSSFDTDGVVNTNITGSAAGIGIQSNMSQPDKIVVAIANNLVRFVAATGALDTTFDTDGILSTGSGVNTDLVIQSNVGEASRIIVCGYANSGPSDFKISRYLLTGAPDTAFGTGGTILAPIGESSDISTAIRIRSGRIIVAGYTYTTSSFNGDAAIAAFSLTNGAPDTTFDADGKRTDDFGNPAASATGTAIQTDGKIVVVGTNSNSTFAVMRFNPNGALDTSFSQDGKTTTFINSSSGGGSNATDVAIQTDGKIIVVGNAESGFAAVRYNPDGSLDSSFGIGGIVKTPFGTQAYVNAVAIQTDGKIVLAGESGDGTEDGTDFAVARYLANGTLDTTFATGGKLTVGIGLLRDLATSVKIQTDGKIVVGGATKVGSAFDFSIVRLNANGSLDNGFGSLGKLLTDMGAAFDSITEIEIQSDGKIVAAGYTSDQSFYRIAAARYLPNGTLDASFDGDGKVITQINIIFDVAVDAAIQPDGKILVAGYGGNGNSGVFTAVRYNPNGSLDQTYGAGGKVIVDVSGGSDIANALALDSAGRAVIAGDADRFFGIIRLQGDAATSRALFDFDGDGKSDIAVFRPSTGIWYVQGSQAGFYGSQFGQTGDKIVPADYDGDGKADFAVFRNGTWYLQRSTLGFTGISFGLASDVPMPADYDADGKADLAVFRPSTGIWYLQRSTQGFTGIQFGSNGDNPIAADYDGDGKADLAVFRPSTGIWYIERSQLGFTGIQFGQSGDRPAPADYDGDGKADLAVFRTNIWYLQRSQLGFTGIQFGTSGDIPAPADYDGDGKSDLAVFRPSTGIWYLQRSSLGFTGIQFGSSGDAPVSSAYVP